MRKDYIVKKNKMPENMEKEHTIGRVVEFPTGVH